MILSNKFKSGVGSAGLLIGLIHLNGHAQGFESATESLGSGVSTFACAGSNDSFVQKIATSSLSLSFNNVIDAFCGQPGGSACVSVSGGTLPYSYTWNDVSNQTTPCAIALLGNNWYSVTVTDNAGCSVTDSVQINDLPGGQIDSLVIVDELMGGDGSITVFASGFQPPWQYELNGTTIQTFPTFSGLSAGTYTICVTDVMGCTDCISGTVNLIACPTITLSTTEDYNGFDVSCFGDTNGAITATISGGTPPYWYQWNTADTSSVLTNLSAGLYVLAVTDSQGCVEQDSIQLFEPPALDLQVTSVPESDSCNGSAQITASGGVPPYQYLWDAATGGQVTETAVDLCEGNYCVAVTDTNGCTADTCVAVGSIVGIAHSRTKRDFKLYPNPNPGTFTIQVPESGGKEIRIYNSLGKCVQKLESSSSELYMDLRMAPGNYVMEVHTAGVVIRKRFIVVP